MLATLFVSALIVARATADTCQHCICLHESGCKPIDCEMDVGSLSCGYYQIKLPYYEDCGTPGRANGEDLNTAWRQCANDYNCSTTCLNSYSITTTTATRVTVPPSVKEHARLCPVTTTEDPLDARTATVQYWNAIKSCCNCS